MFLAAIRFVTILLICIFNSACISNKLSISRLEGNIHKIGIASAVAMPDSPYLKNINVNSLDLNSGGLDQIATGMVFSAVSRLIDIAFNGTPESMLKSYMESNNIHMDVLLYDAFKQSINRKELSGWSLDDDTNDMVFKLAIKKYGLRQLSPFNPFFKPVVEIEVLLVDKHNRVLWRDRQMISHRDERTSRMRLDQYMNNSLFLRKALHKSIQLAVSKVVKKIH